MSSFDQLRERYKTFLYRKVTIERMENEYRVVFDLSIPGLCDFAPEWRFPVFREIDEEILKRLCFPLGMAEAISYFKCACPRDFHIMCGTLTEEQSAWWRKLFYHGLGEFLYRNKIHVSEEELVTFHCETKESGAEANKGQIDDLPEDGVLVPVGGGKDSVVSLELLKGQRVVTYTINRNETEQHVIDLYTEKVADYNATRRLDGALLRLNEQGFLNGHTPFSAIVAFSSYIAAYLSGMRYIALSNETSANETTVADSFVNHQYSKSYEFEQDFMRYMKDIVKSDIEYFSLLRPLSELQIAALFSRYTKYHSAFRSCNVGSKKGIWCCNCPKCLFVYTILSPFLREGELNEIFSEALFDKESLDEDFRRLTGILPDKPFECVGTRREVLAALSAYQSRGGKGILTERYRRRIEQTKTQVSQMLTEWVSENNVPKQFEDLVKRGIEQWKSFTN